MFCWIPRQSYFHIPEEEQQYLEAQRGGAFFTKTNRLKKKSEKMG
jgi:hypothetical protein